MSSLAEVAGSITFSQRKQEQPFNLDLMEFLQAVVSASASLLPTSWQRNVRRRVEAQEEEAAEPAEQQEATPAPLSLLTGAQGVQQLLASGFAQVFDKTVLMTPGGAFPRDHLFRTLVSSGIIQDERVFFKAGALLSPSSSSSSLSAQEDGTAPASTPVPLATLVGAYQLGPGGCGHAGITHGGLTAALFDESLGELLYVAKTHGVLSFRYVVTASLEVSYKQPWALAATPVVFITASVSEVNGRKIWVDAVVADAPVLTSGTTPADAPGDAARPTPTVFATARALFLEPRAEGNSNAALQRAAQGRTDQLGGVVE